MAKTAVSQWDTTANNNTDIGGISLAENVMQPPAVNDAIREMMAQIKAAAFITGVDLGALIAALTAKATPVDADTIAIADSGASNASKKVTLSNLWANYLKSKADALYLPVGTVTYVPIDIQTFTTSGTWTKPSSGTMALIRAWGGGGGGMRGNIGGGGGGGYKELWVPLSTLAATVTVTVGAGGVGRTGSTGVGLAGGDTSFGSLLTAYGGAGGAAAGGGIGGGVTASGGSDGVWSGGVGGGNIAGGNSYMGGGGGCGAGTTTIGGVSFAGGNGGATKGAVGSAPGGGGAAHDTANGGNGARGQVEVYVF